MVVLAVSASGKWDFRLMGVSRAFLRSVALKRDKYVKLPDGVEKVNVACWATEAAVMGEYSA